MKSKHLLPLCSFFLLAGSAVQSQAAIIQFTSNLTEGDVTTTTPSGANDLVTLLDGDFSGLTISGAPSGNGSYGTLFLPIVYTPTTLTVTGSIPGLAGLAGSSTLLTINFSAAGISANATGTTFSLNFPTNVTSIVVSPTLLTDLGLSGSIVGLTAFTDTGAVQGTGLNSYTSSNPSLTLTTGVPEPSSQMLITLGSAFLGLGFVARKKLL
jgi:hypothetical protein